MARSYTVDSLIATKKLLRSSWVVILQLKLRFSFNSYQIRSDKMKSCHFVIRDFPRGICTSAAILSKECCSLYVVKMGVSNHHGLANIKIESKKKTTEKSARLYNMFENSM